MQLLLRDDDTCAMTRPEELEGCYGELWDELPVCLSVTPFRIPGRSTGVPEHLLDSDEVLPLERNAELVAFLAEQIRRGRVQVALHGYHHDRPRGRAEYEAGDDLARKTQEGRRYLEQLLGCRVRAFVPPNNRLSAQGWSAVVAAGLDVVSNQTRLRLRPLPPLAETVREAIPTAALALRHRLDGGGPYRLRRLPRYAQAPFHTVGPDQSLADLRTRLAACHGRGGIFVLATHYHAFGRELRSGERVAEAVRRLIDDARAMPGTRFVGYDGIFGTAAAG